MENNFAKLTNAVCDLSEFLPETDLLKNKIKETALKTMDSLILVFRANEWVQIKDCLPGVKEKSANDSLQGIVQLLNYLEINKKQNLLRGLNYLIISNEYKKIKNNLEILEILKKPNLPPRQEKIIEILKEKGKAQVMDINQVLKDVTKRTIRRDLDELLGAKKIEREGRFNGVFYKMADGT